MKIRMTAIALASCALFCNAYADTQTTTTTSTIGTTVTTSQDQLKQMTAQAFLASNKDKPGVVTTSDGLQYKIITKGNGPKPTSNDTVTVDYAGKLIDGTEFDSSYKRGQPATFPVKGVIPGWTEALQMMPVGSTWELYIPPELAYGSAGAPPAIAPNQALIFKVHLISINQS